MQNAQGRTQNERGRKRLYVAISLSIMLLGILMVCQPFSQPLFRFGLVVTILGIVAFTVAGHLKDDAPNG